MARKLTYDDIPVSTIVACPECGTSNSREDNFCGECGGSLAETKRKMLRGLSAHPEHDTVEVDGMTATGNLSICSECGESNPERNKFCNACGSDLSRGDGPSYPKESASTMLSLRPVSSIGGGILLIAFLLLVVAWAWQENTRSLLENTNNIDDYSQLADSLANAGRLWNLGVLVVVLGAVMVALAQVRK